MRSPNNKQVIFEEARRLFALHGYTGVSLERIARASGIGKTTLLHYYSSKRRLYAMVLRQSISSFSEVSEMALSGSPYQQASALMKRLLYWMVEQPYHAKLLNRAFADNPGSANLSARKYWLPLVSRFKLIGQVHEFDMQNPASGGEENLESLMLILTNSIFHLAFSLELQLQLIDDEGNVDRLLMLYENEINRILFRHFNPHNEQ